MSSNRFSGLNIVLLVVTVLSLMVGAYGFVSGGLDESPRSSIQVEAGELGSAFEGDGPTNTKPLDDDFDRNNPKPETRPRPTNDGSKTPKPGTTSTEEDSLLPEITTKSQPTDRGNAVIQGSVIGANGGPVADATITARRSDLDLEPPKFDGEDLEQYRRDVSGFLKKAAQETRSTETDGQGNFRFEGLDPTLAYDLTASSDTRGSAEQKRVAAGDTVVLLLSAESMLIGRVETADGQPVKKFSVKAWRPNRQWEATNQSFEDEQGRFSMPGKNGSMQVEVTATGLTHTEPADVEVGPDAQEVVIVLDQAAILTGIVSDKAGNPLADVRVTVGGGNDQRRNRWNQSDNGPSARTDSKGRYRFETLPPKETKLTAELGEMSETQTTTLVKGDNQLDFSMDIGAVIKLRLTDPSGKALEPDNIWFQQKDGRGWPRPERMPSKEPGLAEYVGLVPGEYSMTVSAAGFPAIKQDIQVNAGDNEFDLKFSTGAMLTGTVSSSSGSKVSNIGVRLRKQDEERWGGWGTGRYAQVGEDGTYKLGPAEPGQWRLEVYTTGNWTEVYGDTISLSEGDNSHNITVDAGSSVIVKLVDAEGNPISWGNITLQGTRSYNGSSNGDGVATISFVEVGSYNLVATSRGLAAPTQFVSLRAGDNQFTVQLQKPNSCRLTHVYPDTQASRAGMQEGDLVTEYNGVTITSWRQLGQEIRKTKAADDVTVLVDRGGSMLTMNIKGGTVGIEGADAVR